MGIECEKAETEAEVEAKINEVNSWIGSDVHLFEEICPVSMIWTQTSLLCFKEHLV